MNESPNNSVQQIWQSQPVEVTKMSLTEICRRADKLEHRVWWRNAREYVGSLIGVILFASFIQKTHDPLFRIAYALFIAGMVWIVIQLRRKASARNIPLDGDTLTSLRLYRAELERQRDVVKNVWPWYLAPLVPGFVVYTIAYAIAFPRPLSWAGLALLDTVIAALFYGVWRMNLRAARCLDRMIHEVNGGAK